MNIWLDQQMERMEKRIMVGQSCRRSVDSAEQYHATEFEIRIAVKKRGWRVARVGTDYVFGPSDYVFRLLV
jgi:hypothetical protein